MLLLVHWIACGWYLLIRDRGSWVPPKDLDYPSRIDNELWTKTDFYDQDNEFKYATVFYYAILTMVGNEIAPRTTTQTLVSSLIIITGAIVSAFIFGNMAALMATMNKKSTHFDEQLDLVNSTMRQMKLPEEIQDHVLKFMFHVQNQPDLHQDLDTFFSILNDPLRKQILYHNNSQLLKQVQFFADCSSVEQCFFICKLKPVLFLPKDNVVSEGEQGDNLYFISKGQVGVSIRDGTTKQQNFIKYLEKGVIFGEVALLTKLKRTATIVSEEYSNCAYLNNDDIEQIEHNFPHIVKQFKNQIKDYKDEIMNFRRLMVRNIHYLKDLNDTIINEIICHLEVKRYAQGSIILKNGDVSNKLMFLRKGEIDVKVTNQVSQEVKVTEETELPFDVLNTVSTP